MKVVHAAVAAAFVAAMSATAAIPQAASPVTNVSTHSSTRYKTIDVNGIKIFYREAGPEKAPVLLLLHGFPSSSRQFDNLIPLLANKYRVIAPDYPGFGNSSTPNPDTFAYTFENLTQSIHSFTEKLGLERYTIYLNDYGGPVGYRLAIIKPEAVTGLIIQNAVAHEEGLVPALWQQRRAFWADRSANEAKLRANLISPEATRLRHIGASPHPERYNPDLWQDELAFLKRPGQDRIQSDLFYDYRTNLQSYVVWHDYLRRMQPPALILWGKYDPSFSINEVDALKRLLPKAEDHILDAGHFALDEATDEIAHLIQRFLAKHITE